MARRRTQRASKIVEEERRRFQHLQDGDDAASLHAVPLKGGGVVLRSLYTPPNILYSASHADPDSTVKHIHNRASPRQLLGNMVT
jgi:hypothetical protein